MSKLLLVEPDKMLRHAFLVALFPEFEMQIVESMADAMTNNFDVLIVDAAALQERALRSRPIIPPPGLWHRPLIWIDSEPAVQVPYPDRCIQLKRPVLRESLRGAVAQCLRAGDMPEVGSSLRADATKAARRPKRKTKAAPHGATDERADVIELVDVVEEFTER